MSLQSQTTHILILIILLLESIGRHMRIPPFPCPNQRQEHIVLIRSRLDFVTRNGIYRQHTQSQLLKKRAFSSLFK